MNFLILVLLIAGVMGQVTFPDDEITTTTSTKRLKTTISTTTTPTKSPIPTAKATISTTTTPTTSTTRPRTSPTTSTTTTTFPISTTKTTSTTSITSSTSKTTTTKKLLTTTTAATTTEGAEEDYEEPEEESTEEPAVTNDSSKCLCVPKNSCDEILGGNATQPETDGAGIIQGRILNNGPISQNNYGTNMSMTSPMSTGTTLQTIAPSFCIAKQYLELCCPKTGYQCGTSLPFLNVTSNPSGNQKRTEGSARYGQFPWEAIIFTFRQSYVGTGALIDQLHVISVAHRFDRYDSKMTFKIRLGDWDTASLNEPLPYLEYNVSKMFKHPNYNKKNLKFDLIVLRLLKPVPLARYPTINPICLPSKPILPPTICWVAGYGQNDFLKGTNQAIMKAVDVPLVESTSCQRSLRNTNLTKSFVLDTKQFLCAGGVTGKDSCTGDGGAPLVCKDGNQWYLQGLVCWGIECGKEYPSVYVNISNFLPWIVNVTKI